MENIDWGTLLWVGSTLLGTAIGAFFSWWSTHTVENIRLRNERNRRFESDRKILYVKLLRTATELSFKISNREPITTQQRIEFMNLLSEVEVLASPITRKPALNFVQVINDQIFRPEKQVSMDVWLVRRKDFIEAVHKDLGIALADDAVSPSPPSPSAGITESWSKLKAQTQMPLPVVSGGIGLLMAFAVPDGLSGGQGFVIGFVLGVVLIALTARQVDNQRTN